jgi:ATP-dependent RNA helicase DDX52/ROK1
MAKVENRQSLPTELDFFKYAEGGQGKRKTSRKDVGRDAKRMKVDTDGDGVGSEDDDEEGHLENVYAGSSAPRQSHRISIKGINPPKEITTFEELKDRYSLPAQLYANLEKNGYYHPTGIQSIGVPTLLEVS